jgi:segregation and condensation protein B
MEETKLQQESSVEAINRNGRLAPAIESMLFVASEPISEERLSEVLGADKGAVSRAIEELIVRYSDGWGLALTRVAGGWRLETKPEHSDYVTRLLSPARRRFSAPAMEVLAIVAYKQPVTQPEIEAIRGVSCDSPLNTLIEGNLVKPVGRKEAPGRPILYATTRAFLIEFGLNDLAELPPVEVPDPQSAEAAPVAAEGTECEAAQEQKGDSESDERPTDE